MNQWIWRHDCTAPFHQRSALILMLPIPEGQTGQTAKLPKRNSLSEMCECWVKRMFNLGPTRCTLYSLFLSSLALHFFGCYLHPSSGAQLQRTAIVCVSVENRGFNIKWCGGFILHGFVCTRFSKPRVTFLCWCVCVCVSMDLFW
jgi:hypothetical protein